MGVGPNLEKVKLLSVLLLLKHSLIVSTLQLRCTEVILSYSPIVGE
jgi:hypothetical protein